MKDFRILKTSLILFASMLVGLSFPIFGQWYEQQTGLIPISLYLIGGFGGFILTLITILKVWGQIK